MKNSSCFNRRKQNFFNRFARDWDVENRSHHLMRIDQIFEDYSIEPTANIVDVGCGTGILIPALQRHARKPFSLFELDFSLEMIRENKRDCSQKSGLYHINGDALCVPVPDQSFDWIMAFAVLPHLGNTSGAIKEWSRILKRGGTLVLLHLMSSAELNEFHNNLDGIVRHDRLLPVNELADLFEKNNWEIELHREEEGLYLLIVKKR